MARFCPLEVARSVPVSASVIVGLLVFLPSLTSYKFFNYTRCSEVCHEGHGFILDQCCYVPVFHPMTWDDARNYCKSEGGPMADLACPLSNYAMRYELERAKLPKDQRMWVGVYTKPNQDIVYVTGKKVNCMFVEEPVNDTCGCTIDPDATMSYPYAYLPANCSEELPFICQMPLD